MALTVWEWDWYNIRREDVVIYNITNESDRVCAVLDIGVRKEDVRRTHESITAWGSSFLL